MAYEIDTATDAGAGGLAHYDMLDKIAAFATTDTDLIAAGQQWTIMRYDETAANRELILKGPGLSGAEEVFVGFRTYQSVSSDYYNLVAGAFVGYVPGNTFDTQPGAMISGVPAHNRTIDYYMIANGQRIALAMKVGTPVYESAYVGKMFPTALPGEYPMPLVCAGMLNGAPATRFSDLIHSMPYKGARANLKLRSNAGVWLQPDTVPWNNIHLCGSTAAQSQIRPSGTQYKPVRIALGDATNEYGFLDGILQITGFDNSVESVFQAGGSYVVDHAGKTLNQIITEINGAAGGRAYLVMQDVHRTGFNDMYLMEMS